MLCSAHEARVGTFRVGSVTDGMVHMIHFAWLVEGYQSHDCQAIRSTAVAQRRHMFERSVLLSGGGGGAPFKHSGQALLGGDSQSGGHPGQGRGSAWRADL